MIYAIFTVVIAAIIICYGLLVFNRIITLTKNIDEAWANITVALQKRHDIIPRLMDIANVSKDYELTVQKSLAAMRDQDIQTVNDSERTIQKSVQIIGEAYPKLKADITFKELFDQLVTIEDGIQGDRLLFNRAVALYRRELSAFPAGIFATAFGFSRLEFFEVDPSLER